MTAETILYIVIAGVLAFAISVFMYGYRAKLPARLKWLFGSLRFLTLLTLFVLIINPLIRNTSYTTVKPKLTLLVDNSASISELNQGAISNDALNSLRSNQELNEQFDLSFYYFGMDIKRGDSVTYDERNSNISRALQSAADIFRNDTGAMILLSDGNQTFGQDYEFISRNLRKPVFPVILGDSTQFKDLRITQLNTNRYAFLKNQFPVEVTMVYSGNGPVNSTFSIRSGSATLHTESLSFSEADNTKTLLVNLPASAVGLQKYTASIAPLPDEKNQTNNTKQFAVEVIDEATNVLLISKMSHPDLGAIKKAITSNEQRRITFKKPNADLSDMLDYQLVILYQPDGSFQNAFSLVDRFGKNNLIITGTQTDWDFLNFAQLNFEKDAGFQNEESSVSFNPNYGAFGLEDIGFESFPPLMTSFGDLLIIAPHEVILEQSIDGFLSGSPLLATMEENGIRSAILDGEDIWKWRAQVYLEGEEFLPFDDFIGRIVQYLASNKRRSRLEVSAESFYYNNNRILVSAQYFDQNYVFDPRASLSISVTNEETGDQTSIPMLLKSNYYEVDLSALEAGNYAYTVNVRDEAVARSGSFTILDFNVEQQFLNADVTKLRRLATNSGGEAFFPAEVGQLSQLLMDDERFKAVQKSEQKVVPLIDWKYLLALLALLLGAEWFIRKYNGLI